MTCREIGEGEARKPATPPNTGQSDAGIILPSATTGGARPAKAAVGDKPVFAYIAGVPQPQRGIAEAVNSLAGRTARPPALGEVGHEILRRRGWVVLELRRFAGHVKLMFINGAALKPVPPVMPVGMGKSTRGVELDPLMTSTRTRLRHG